MRRTEHTITKRSVTIEITTADILRLLWDQGVPGSARVSAPESGDSEDALLIVSWEETDSTDAPVATESAETSAGRQLLWGNDSDGDWFLYDPRVGPYYMSAPYDTWGLTARRYVTHGAAERRTQECATRREACKLIWRWAFDDGYLVPAIPEEVGDE